MLLVFLFFLNHTATTEIYPYHHTLSLHAALPIETAPAWLGWKHNLPAETARQRVRHARALRNLPALQEAWAGGEIDRYHITTLLGARNGRTAEAFDQDHKVLLDAAKGLGFRDFKSFRDRWMGTVDPEIGRAHV